MQTYCNCETCSAGTTNHNYSLDKANPQRGTARQRQLYELNKTQTIYVAFSPETWEETLETDNLKEVQRHCKKTGSEFSSYAPNCYDPFKPEPAYQHDGAI